MVLEGPRDTNLLKRSWEEMGPILEYFSYGTLYTYAIHHHCPQKNAICLLGSRDLSASTIDSSAFVWGHTLVPLFLCAGLLSFSHLSSRAGGFL